MVRFHSTNRKTKDVDFKTAVLRSLASDKGLYMLNDIPRLNDDEIYAFKNMEFIEIALFIISKFIGDIISEEKLIKIINAALNFKIPV